jgi:hypothetical protein
VVTATFFLDIVLRFNRVRVHGDTFLPSYSRRFIAKAYIRSWFLIDLASTMPWDMFTSSGSSPRLFRLLRLMKLLRLLKASAITQTLMKFSSVKMSSWTFVKTLVILIVVIHWWTCIWMICGVSGGDSGWPAAYGFDDFEEGPSNTTRRLKLKQQSGSQNGLNEDESADYATQSEYAKEAGFYFIALEFTLASLGVWPYDIVKPHNQFERNVAAVMIFAAALIYAWLTGVIVELVSRATQDSRDIDGKFDVMISYLDNIKYPHGERHNFIHFYWHARPYLTVDSLQNNLPELPKSLTGQLTRSIHGRTLDSIPLFNCSHEDERRRFHIEIAQDMVRTSVADTPTKFHSNKSLHNNLLHLPPLPTTTTCTNMRHAYIHPHTEFTAVCRRGELPPRQFDRDPRGHHACEYALQMQGRCARNNRVRHWDQRGQEGEVWSGAYLLRVYIQPARSPG